MNALSKIITGTGSMQTLGVIFPPDTYGQPRYIDFIFPNGLKLDLKTRGGKGFAGDGDTIRITNDTSNGNLVWRFPIYEADDSASRLNWANHALTMAAGDILYAIAYY